MNTTGKTTNWNDYCFERTVYANMKLSKLCPGHDIAKLGEVLEDPDTQDSGLQARRTKGIKHNNNLSGSTPISGT